MTTSRAVVAGRCAGIVLLAAIMQVSAASSLALLGVRPELTLLLAVAAGVAGGPDRGALVGFALGLAYDLFLQTPLGLTALVYSLVAYGAGAVQLQMSAQRRPARMLFVGSGTVAGVVGWVLAGSLLDAVGPGVLTTLRVALVAGAVNAIAAVPATRLWTWVFGGAEPGRLGP